MITDDDDDDDVITAGYPAAQPYPPPGSYPRKLPLVILS